MSSPEVWRAALSAPVLEAEQRLVADRRTLHRQPELAFEETRTAGLVATRLRDLGWSVTEGVGGTGVVGLLEGGGGEGPVILFRADMDALPLQEDASHDYASEVPGKMHACGHDAHVAIGLTVAELLANVRSQWQGTVKLMFQPAEEGAFGALRMMEDGLLENPKVDAAFALHVSSNMEVGHVGVREGCVFAGCTDFEIRMRGEGGHAAMPHQSNDPLHAAAQCVSALQSVVSRRMDANELAVLTVATFHAGTKTNIIADHADISGTLRARKPEVLALLGAELTRTAKGVAAAHGVEADIKILEGFPPVINDARWASEVQTLAIALLGSERVSEDVLSGSEDMAFVLEEIPGCYFLIGARNEEKGIVAPHHSPQFDVDEGCLLVGAELALRVIRQALVSAA